MVLLGAGTPWTIPDAGAQSLPSGWSSRDIGKPPSAGSATFVSPTFTVTSKGYDVNGTADQFTFASTSISGDVTIIARLITLPNVNPWAQAGLMIRDGTGTGSRHAFVFGTPGNGLLMRSRQSRRGSTSQTSGGAGAVPVWLKLERRSSTFTASRSANGTSWTTIGSVTVSLSQSALVGLAVASHSATVGVAASFDNVTINGQGWTPANTPPAVSLTSPANGTSYASPAAVPFAATATDANGTIAKVEFYAGTTLVGTDTTSPYAFNWTGVGAGTYVLKAVATDNAGASTTSATRTVTVSGSNVAPTVSMTSPANGTSFVGPLSITLSATASDPDGTIQRVEFYVGSILVATDATSPYSTTWLAILGPHSVNAVATDNQGARTSSAWRDFVVTATPVLSTAIFKPASPADVADYYVFEVFVAGADPNVAAPIATKNLGVPPVVAGESSADVGATVLGLAPGGYIATVASVGSAGTLRSNSFSFAR